MEAEAAKFIGAGIAAVGMAGAAIGVGNIFGSFLSGALRNPGAAESGTEPQTVLTSSWRRLRAR